MVKFVEDFNPQIIYCQGYSLTFSWLPVMLHNKFHIPICFQTGDDWPFYIYKDTAFSIVIKPIVHRAVKSLLSKSSARLANGKLMASEFNQKYGLSFEPLMMCDNLERFRKASPYRIASSDKISIIYTGGLAHGRWLSIIDLCDAAALLQNEGVNIMVTILATNIMPDVINKLSEINNLQILPGPSHEQLPSYLKGADILYLPESLNSIIAADIHLSISTKAHLYMMSEKPVLIYASNITGIANYAKENDWACIVEERNLDKLAQALRNIITNKEYREELVNKGIKVVSINHAEDKVRARFLTILTGLTNSN
jgi:glycosyltransferase involved in cell wall biosynthesis